MNFLLEDHDYGALGNHGNQAEITVRKHLKLSASPQLILVYVFAAASHRHLSLGRAPNVHCSSLCAFGYPGQPLLCGLGGYYYAITPASCCASLSWVLLVRASLPF